MPKKDEPRKFEDAFERLTEIVELLEAGEKGLEESLDLYAEGMKLVQLCGKKLTEAEKKIERLKLSAPAEGLEAEEDPDAAD
jgi:exodeoxyribonuclease VII small subunit